MSREGLVRVFSDVEVLFLYFDIYHLPSEQAIEKKNFPSQSWLGSFKENSDIKFQNKQKQKQKKKKKKKKKKKNIFQ